MNKPCKSLADIKATLEIMFMPDVRLKWSDRYNCYFMTSISEAGKIALKKYRPNFTHGDNGFIVFDIDAALKYLGHFGLCSEIIDKSTENESNTK